MKIYVFFSVFVKETAFPLEESRASNRKMNPCSSILSTIYSKVIYFRVNCLRLIIHYRPTWRDNC